MALGLDRAAPTIVCVFHPAHTSCAQRLGGCADGEQEAHLSEHRKPLCEWLREPGSGGVAGQGGGMGEAVLCILSAFLQMFENL